MTKCFVLCSISFNQSKQKKSLKIKYYIGKEDKEIHTYFSASTGGFSSKLGSSIWKPDMSAEVKNEWTRLLFSFLFRHFGCKNNLFFKHKYFQRANTCYHLHHRMFRQSFFDKCECGVEYWSLLKGIHLVLIKVQKWNKGSKHSSQSKLKKLDS